MRDDCTGRQTSRHAAEVRRRQSRAKCSKSGGDAGRMVAGIGSLAENDPQWLGNRRFGDIDSEGLKFPRWVFNVSDNQVVLHVHKEAVAFQKPGIHGAGRCGNRWTGWTKVGCEAVTGV
jgi:hypothetical protein